MSTRLQLDKLNKSFGDVTVIPSVDLEVKAGEFIAFVGPSGCGKSTLLRLIAGLETATNGQISIDGNDVTEVAPADRGIAMVFQSYALYPHMTVEENMEFGLKMNGVSVEDRNAAVQRAADILQLGTYLKRKPKELSGGQRQRVAIGRAIVRNPKIFLFDEPLSNLDAELRVEMRLQLSRLHKQLGDATMIYVTHDQVEAMTMADRIALLRAGKVEQFGTPMQLYHHPKNQFVAGFIGSPRMNFFSATLQHADSQESILKLADGSEIKAPIDTSGATTGDSLTVGLRPEDISPEENQNSLGLKVDVSENLGGRSYLYGAAHGMDNFVVETKGSIEKVGGESMTLYFASQDLHLFNAEGQAFKRLQAPA